MNNSGNEAEVSLELKLNKTSRAKYEGTLGSFKRLDKRLIPESSVRKGFRASGIDHLSKGGSWHDTKPSVRNNFGRQGCTWESGFDPVELWVMGPPCAFTARRCYILHGHDSKASQRIACQLCWQQRWYQGWGTKRTIFLLARRGGPIGKVLVHRWLPGCHQQ